MATTIACLAGEEIHRQWSAGRITGQRLGPRETPFGASQEVFLVDGEEPFYLLPRYGREAVDVEPGTLGIANEDAQESGLPKGKVVVGEPGAAADE